MSLIIISNITVHFCTASGIARTGGSFGIANSSNTIYIYIYIYLFYFHTKREAAKASAALRY